MSSTFSGIDVALRALRAQQQALEVTNHNVANANTPGYTRQDAIMSATSPLPFPSMTAMSGHGQMGTGVEITEIRRLRDKFLDDQFRHESEIMGNWEMQRDTLQKLQTIFNEPSDAGLNSVMNAFWNAFQELSKNPESLAIRANVRQQGVALVNTFHQLDQQFKDLRTDLESSIQTRVNEINSYAAQIRDLNEQIVRIESTGDRANDLRDKRDYLVDSLAKIVNVSTRENAVGSLTVSIGGRALVDGTHTAEITVKSDLPTTNHVLIKWADTGDPGDPATMTDVDVQSGSLAGLVASRNTILEEYAQGIDRLAAEIVNQVNLVHATDASAGHYTYDLEGNAGGNFFAAAGTITAATINLDGEILNGDAGLKRIAAAATVGATGTPKPGDGEIALKIAQLAQQTYGALQNGSFADYYRSMLARLGVQGQEAIRMVDNQKVLADAIDTQRQSVSGVSLDEEMTNMVKYQHSYAAASRMMTALDEMLDTLITRMGLVGR